MKKVIAVDFDGTLCTNNWPEVGVSQTVHKLLISSLIMAHRKGHIIILWTCREDTEDRKYLAEALEYCKKNNIPIDYVNEAPPEMKKLWGNDPRKICADVYIDDRSININYIIEMLDFE